MMGGPGQMMDGGMGGMMWIGAVLGLVVTLLLLAALALTVVWLWQTVRDSGPPAARRSRPADVRGGSDEADPLEILERRYARGELSEDEFERMREKLRNGA